MKSIKNKSFLVLFSDHVILTSSEMLPPSHFFFHCTLPTQQVTYKDYQCLVGREVFPSIGLALNVDPQDLV